MQTRTLTGFVVASCLLAWTGLMCAPASARMCNPRPPEYPGCTNEQIKQIEPHTPKKMVKRFRHGKYGKFHLGKVKLSKRANRHMRKLYRHAVVRFEKTHRSHKRPIEPKYPSWFDFKHASPNYCVAVGPAYIKRVCAPNVWYYTGKGVNKAFKTAKKLTLTCGGVALAAAAGGAAAGQEELFGVGVIPGAIGGAIGGGTTCAVQKVGGFFYGWFDGIF